MEGLIPFLFRAVKKQRPQNAYRCLSENSSAGRSYSLLVGASGDSAEGSSHRRVRSESQPPFAVDLPRVAAASPPSTDSGLRHRGFATGSPYQGSGGRSNNTYSS